MSETPKAPRDLGLDLERVISGGEGAELEPTLRVLQAGSAYHRGSTSPVISTEFTRNVGGLLVPEGAAKPTLPIDAMGVFLTFQDVFGTPIAPSTIVDWLRTRATADVLAGCAALLSIMQAPDANLKRVAVEMAQVFREPARTKILNLLGQGRVLLATQSIMKLAKMAVLHCQQDEANAGEPVRPMDLLVPLLGIQQHLGRRPRWSGTQLRGLSPDNDRGVTADVIRNQHFNRAVDEATAFATFERRWKRLPRGLSSHPEHVDLMEAYRAATGVELDDLFAGAIGLWTLAISSDPPRSVFDASWSSGLMNWDSQRVQHALAPLTTDIPALRAAISSDQQSAEDDWSFDEFRRWPLVRVSDRVLVLSPHLLIERVTGWTLTLDLTGFGRSTNKTQQRAVNFFRHVCEAQVHDSLENIAGGSGAFRRFWSGDDLKAAFGKTTKVADAAVEYETGWLIFEVTSSQIRRSTLLSGNLRELEQDLVRFVIIKARQLAATIEQIRADEERLTGFNPRQGRKFLPALVLTEGMPLGPITDACIRQMLRDEGLFNSEDVLPLEIIDSYDLDMLEGVLAHGGGDALNYLRSHQGSSLSSMPLASWLIDAHRSKCVRADRVSAFMNSAFDRLMATLGPFTSEDDDSDASDDQASVGVSSEAKDPR